MSEISVIVGDIQRLIIYPQFGWQEYVNVPKYIIEKYHYLKNLGFSKYVYSKEQIEEFIKKNGLMKGFKANYFN